MLRNVATVLGVFALVLASAGFASAEYYTITDLGVPTNYNDSQAKDISSDGDVSAMTTSPTHDAFFYDTSAATWTKRGNLSSSYDSNNTQRLNDSDQITGYSKNSSNKNEAYIADSSGINGIGFLATGKNTYGYGIDSSGHVVGWGQNSSNNAHGFYYDGATMYDVGVLDGAGADLISKLQDITPDGSLMVGGAASSTNTHYQAATCTWDSGTSTATWTKMENGLLSGDNEAIATAVSNNGQYAAGYSYGDDGSGDDGVDAFLWKASTDTMINLTGSLAGADYRANDVNNAGHVVGYGTNAWYYDGTTVHDLFDLIDPTEGWTSLTQALGINDSEQIVGYGVIGGATHAFIITVPEPSTLVLLACGAIGLLAYAWRKRK